MSNVVPSPASKVTVVVRDEHLSELKKLGAELQRKHRQAFTVSYIIDHLIANADLRKLAGELVKK